MDNHREPRNSNHQTKVPNPIKEIRGIPLTMMSRSRRSHGDGNEESQDVPDTPQRLNQIDENDANDDSGGLLSNKNDEIDRSQNDAHVTNWDIFFLGFSMFTFIVDVGLDISLALRYYSNDKMTEFALTIIFVLLPAIVNTLISIRMYNQDLEMDMESIEEGVNMKECGSKSLTELVAQRKACCILVLLFQLAPVLRYCDSLRYAFKARRSERQGDDEGKRRYYHMMLREDQDIALLMVLECFLEAAPQQILQLSILLTNYNRKIPFTFETVHQICSLSSSLVSMGWVMASYHRNTRKAQRDKLNISIRGTIAQFLWHFCVTVSRILSISVAASIWPIYTAVGCALHWVTMTIWLLAEPHGSTEFCRDRSRAPHTPLTVMERVRSTLFISIFGIVYLFTYIDLREGSTFLRHSFYYTLCLIENVTVASLWACSATPEFSAHWYFKFLLVLCIAPFLIGMIAMLSYYKYFHPTCMHNPTYPKYAMYTSIQVYLLGLVGYPVSWK